MDYHIAPKNQASNKQSSNTSLLIRHPPYIQINVLIGRGDGLYFLIKEIFRSIC